MSRTRSRPIDRGQAAAGAFAIVASVLAIVWLSYSLLLPVKRDALPPSGPQEPTASVAVPSCPANVADSSGPALKVDSVELIECPDTYDGARVAYEGEAVGAVMRRGDHAWLQLNDDVYGLTAGPLPQHRATLGSNSGMAVLIPVSEADGIITGSFNRSGTVIAVTGTFRKDHPADPGAPAIAADDVRRAQESEPVEHPLSVPRLAVAAVLAATTAALATVWRRRMF